MQSQVAVLPSDRGTPSRFCQPQLPAGPAIGRSGMALNEKVWVIFVRQSRVWTRSEIRGLPVWRELKWLSRCTSRSSSMKKPLCSSTPLTCFGSSSALVFYKCRSDTWGTYFEAIHFLGISNLLMPRGLKLKMKSTFIRHFSSSKPPQPCFKYFINRTTVLH